MDQLPYLGLVAWFGGLVAWWFGGLVVWWLGGKTKYGANTTFTREESS